MERWSHEALVGDDAAAGEVDEGLKSRADGPPGDDLADALRDRLGGRGALHDVASRVVHLHRGTTVSLGRDERGAGRGEKLAGLGDDLDGGGDAGRERDRMLEPAGQPRA